MRHIYRLPFPNWPVLNSSGDVYARWLDFPGEQLVSQVEVEIGGQRIDRQYGDWMHYLNQLTLQRTGTATSKWLVTPHSSQASSDPQFAAVDGDCLPMSAGIHAPRNALTETTLYAPLQFWYCRNPGLALPQLRSSTTKSKLTPTSATLKNAGGC